MPENQHTGWKESWRDEYMRWICGVANAAGGVLVIGRNDQGVAVGAPDADKLLVDLPNKVRDNAIIHRDYSVGSPIQIRVYEDRLKIWNPGELPEGWSVRKLQRPHSSRPFNPAIAHAFFRAGEIEAWGRGIEKIFDACRVAGTPKPRIKHEHGDMWLEFPFSSGYLDTLSGAPRPGTEPASSGKVSGKMSGKIVQLMREQPDVTIPELARRLGRTERTIERQINRLMASGVIGRVGPAKGGHWEVSP